jgi:cytochrome c553
MTPRWRRRVLGACAVLGLLSIAGLVVAASGIIPIKASTGHWDITEWLLQFGKRRSIATHTIGMDLPRLDDPALVMKGAGHYETACQPCHGSPDHERPRIAAAMLPPPPYLPPLIPDRDAAALFYVVKHGIKFTGMPAWPSQQRDDEVHAMVAFLLAMPSLDAAAYRRLVFGDAAARPSALGSLRDLAAGTSGPLRAVIASCDRCHGKDGRGRDTSAFPRLAGQKREYLLRALAAYARDTRHSGIMAPVAAGLHDEERRGLADHYSRMSGLGSGAPAIDAALGPAVAAGRAIVRDGIPDQGVPPCHDCHGPAAQPRNDAYPHLAGQFPDYLVLQLERFKRSQRGGSDYAHLMQRVAARLTSDQMRAAAAYYAALGAGAMSSQTGPPARRERSPVLIVRE